LPDYWLIFELKTKKQNNGFLKLPILYSIEQL